jgi:hypothetical protein
MYSVVPARYSRVSADMFMSFSSFVADAAEKGKTKKTERNAQHKARISNVSQRYPACPAEAGMPFPFLIMLTALTVLNVPMLYSCTFRAPGAVGLYIIF